MFGLVMLGIIGGGLLGMLVLYGLLRLVAATVLGVLHGIALLLRLAAHGVAVTAHSLVLPLHRHRPA